MQLLELHLFHCVLTRRTTEFAERGQNTASCCHNSTEIKRPGDIHPTTRHLAAEIREVHITEHRVFAIVDGKYLVNSAFG